MNKNVIKIEITMKAYQKILIPIIFTLLVLITSACSGSGAMMASSWPGIAVDSNTIYAAYGQFVYAINLESGTLKWRYPADKPDRAQSFYATPALTVEGDLIVGGYDKKLYQLDAANGAVKWVFEDAKDRYIAGPLATERGIYAPNADGSLYALSANKNSLWDAFKTGKPMWSKPATDGKCECIFTASMDHHLYAVDSQTGAQLWKSADLGGAVVAEPIFGENGTVFIGTFGNEMLALDTNTGEIKWRVPTGGWIWSGARLVEGKLYFGDLKGNFYILKASSGELVKSEVLDGPIVGTPTLGNDTIYLGTEAGTLYAYNLDGSPAWSKSISAITKDDKPIGGKLYSPAMISGEMIIVAPVESETFLVALDSKGEVKWLYSSGN